jgi:hypothetical protein
MPQAEIAPLSVQTTLTASLAELGATGVGSIHSELNQEQAEALERKVPDFLRSVSENAKGCCIDGRSCGNCLNGQPTELGPKLAGGPLMSAYVAAEMTGWFADDAGDTRARLHIIKDKLEAEGIIAGAHVDEKAMSNGFVNPDTGHAATGCGADDKAEAIVQTVYDNPELVYALASTVLGGRFNENSMQFMSREMAATAFTDWDPRIALDVARTEDGGNVEALVGAHKEALVIFNYNEGTTFDRDAFEAATAQQAFCVDMWYVRTVAEALATGPNAVLQAVELEHAMVAYQIGTYLTLCDGSQRALLVAPAVATVNA